MTPSTSASVWSGAAEHTVVASWWMRAPVAAVSAFLAAVGAIATAHAPDPVILSFVLGVGFGFGFLMLRTLRVTKLRIRGPCVEVWTHWPFLPWTHVGSIEVTPQLVVESRGGNNVLCGAGAEVQMPGWVESDRVTQILRVPCVVTKS